MKGILTKINGLKKLNENFVTKKCFHSNNWINYFNSILDATKAVFPPESFDVVYSRDAIMHIAEKEPLYEKILVNIMPEIYTQIFIFTFFL